MARTGFAQNIKHVFVLMLENRSFDHMLGFSGITGTDAVSGQTTKITGLTGNESNTYDGQPYGVFHPSDWSMPVDPCHEFLCVVKQLSGQDSYPQGGPYPSIGCDGFAASYAENGGISNPREIMKCYDSSQLPVLTALAWEFVVCDNWFSSVPGPTWPNRYFVHAASSAGLDHSPSTVDIAQWFVAGVPLQNGTIFDKLNAGSKKWRIYRGDEFPQSLSLNGVHFLQDTTPLRRFQEDVTDASKPYQYAYTFIEPNYGNVLNNTYQGGTSQHPLDNIVCGEWIIKYVYEAIRKSPLWNDSLLIVTWDEHGGFYEHVPPGPTVAPGDNSLTSPLNAFGFTFTQLGVRVPAVIVSPRIPHNLIDHRIYDHSSVPATLEAIFGLTAITNCDAQANNVSKLVTLSTPRSTPERLPSPVSEGAQCPFPNPSVPVMAVLAPHTTGLIARPLESPNEGNLPGFLNVAQRVDIELTPRSLRAGVTAKHRLSLSTRANAAAYLEEVRMKARAAEAK
jgi:phospholipase C